MTFTAFVAHSLTVRSLSSLICSLALSLATVYVLLLHLIQLTDLMLQRSVSVKKITVLLNRMTRRKALLAGKQRRMKIMERIQNEQPNFEFDPKTCGTRWAVATYMLW